MQAKAAIAGRFCLRGIGAQIRAALVLGHAHAEERRGFLFYGTKVAIVVA
jgi:hypothetical protein